MPEITADQIAAAEARLIGAKESGDLEEKIEAMQSVADLRSAYRVQEEASGRRAGFVNVNNAEN